MQTREWKWRDKTEWPRGVWDDEPDKIQWTDEATGRPCLIVRNQLGGLCGYVGIDKTHPLFEKPYSTEVPMPEGFMDAEIGKRSPMMMLFLAFREEGSTTVRIDSVFDVHGGITYSDKCQDDHEYGRGICHLVDEGEDDDIWWFGFDCGHHLDVLPGMLARFPEMYGGDERSYRDVAYVKEECARFAKQLVEYAGAK